jgi:DNA-directed RNA polymerase specialized sigma24 family protein
MLQARLTPAPEIDPLADAATIRPLVEQLPAGMREVVLLRLDGMQPREIMQATGRTKDSVCSAWRDGRRLLRSWLAQGRSVPVVDAAEAARVAALDEKRRTQLRQAARSLPTAQREVALRRLDGMRNGEVARAIGCTPDAAASNWIHAQAAFARQGLTVS